MNWIPGVAETFVIVQKIEESSAESWIFTRK